MITANFAGEKIEEVILNDEQRKEAEFQKKSFGGKCPVLETKDGVLSESLAIAKYLAKQAPSANLFGKGDFEAAQVDQWIDFVKGSVQSLAFPAILMICGKVNVDMEQFAHNVSEMKKNLRVINEHLKGRVFLVGDGLTLADIVLGVSLIMPMQILLDPGFRKGHGEITSYFEKLMALPEFIGRVGKVQACQKTMKPIAPPKEAPKKQEAKPKEEAKAPQKKEANPLETLPPSPFNLDEFKTFFVNLEDKRGAGMDHFFKNYDPNGYCIYFVDYDKAEGEGEVLYMTQNLMKGFLQRIDHFRKHTFSMHAVLGEEPKLEIQGVWLFRGTEIPQEMHDNPQFEYYKKRKLDVNNAEDKKLITDFWCAKVGDKVNGMTVQDCKMHK